MGRGGYHGGSSLLSFSWFGWGSGSVKDSKPKKAKASPKTQELIAKQKADKQKKHLEHQAEQQRLAKERKAQRFNEQKRKKVRAGHGDPVEIAARLNRHMEGVEVRRITTNTLRLRKPKD